MAEKYTGPIKIPAAPRKGEVITADFLQGIAGALTGTTAPSRGVPAPTSAKQAEIHGDIDGVGDVFEYYEESRETEEVRVENPSDSSQYVIVENVLKVTMRASDGKLLILNFANDAGEVTTGTSPPDAETGGGGGGSTGSYVQCN